MTLSAEANEVFTDCSEIFTPVTMGKIGANALCSIPDGDVKQLEIKLMVRCNSTANSILFAVCSMHELVGVHNLLLQVVAAPPVQHRRACSGLIRSNS